MNIFFLYEKSKIHTNGRKPVADNFFVVLFDSRCVFFLLCSLAYLLRVSVRLMNVPHSFAQLLIDGYFFENLCDVIIVICLFLSRSLSRLSTFLSWLFVC